MTSQIDAKAEVYTRYPLSSILIYNSVTLLHFLLGGVGIILGYNSSGVAYLLGLLYLAFAFGQMYVMMPLTVCPNDESSRKVSQPAFWVVGQPPLAVLGLKLDR